MYLEGGYLSQLSPDDDGIEFWRRRGSGSYLSEKREKVLLKIMVEIEDIATIVIYYLCIIFVNIVRPLGCFNVGAMCTFVLGFLL